MIAFVIHDAVSSGDEVMFAESVDAWLASYREKNQHAILEKRGEIDSGKEFGRLYRLPYQSNDEKLPETFEDFKKMQEENGWGMGESEYVSAYTVTPELVLKFGG